MEQLGFHRTDFQEIWYLRISLKSVERFNFSLMSHNKNGYLNDIIYMCAGGKIKKNEMGGACGAYGVGEWGVQGSGGET